MFRGSKLNHRQRADVSDPSWSMSVGVLVACRTDTKPPMLKNTPPTR